MLGVLLIVVLIGAGVAMLVAAGTLVIQGYLYSEPVGGLAWRAPAVGAVASLFFGAWCALEWRSPGKYDTLWNFSTRDVRTVDQFWSERTNGPNKEEVLYRRQTADRGTIRYVDPDGRPWRRS